MKICSSCGHKPAAHRAGMCYLCFAPCDGPFEDVEEEVEESPEMSGVHDVHGVPVYVGDVREMLGEIEPHSIHMAITSPPFYGLRCYGTEPQIWGGESDCEHVWGEYQADRVTGGGQRPPQTKWKEGPEYDVSRTEAFCQKCNAWRGELGLEPTPDLFVEHLVECFRPLKKTLASWGSFYLNLGDTYAGTAAGNPGHPGLDTSRGGVGQKNMMGIPWRVAFAMQKDGWTLRNDIIVSKRNAMPSSVRDRLSATYEHFFHFVLEPKTRLWHNERDGGWTLTEPKEKWAACWYCGGVGCVKCHVCRTVCYRCEKTYEENPGRDCEIEGLKCATCPEDCDRRGKRLLWRGFDYFYDLDNVRKPHATTSHARAEYGNMRVYGPDKSKVESDGVLSRSHDMGNVMELHGAGANPGDVDIPKRWGVDDKGQYHGKAVKKYASGGAQDASQLKKNIIAAQMKEPRSGRNPGDVIKEWQKNQEKAARRGIMRQDRRVPREDYPADRPAGYHKNGRNPGDVLKSEDAKKWDDSYPKGAPQTAWVTNIRETHERGGNPGDIMEDKKRDWRKEEDEGRRRGSTDSHRAANLGGLASGDAENHPRGRNPGDVAFSRGYPDDAPHRGSRGGSGNPETSTLGSSHNAGVNPGDVVPQLDDDTVRVMFRDEDEVQVIDISKETFNEMMRRIERDEEMPGDVMTITTRAYKGAHFAVFSPEHVMLPILVASPHYICKSCGAPRGKKIGPDRTANTWVDACACGANSWTKGKVLDPFAGTATALWVARALGRDGVAVELNPDYVKLMKGRLTDPYDSVRAYIKETYPNAYWEITDTVNVVESLFGGGEEE